MSSSKGFGSAGGFGGGKGKGGPRAKKGERYVPYTNPHEDPLAKLGESTGSLEQDTKDELDAIHDAYKGFRERAKKEQQRFDHAVDADYWAGICFKSRDDKEAFFEALGVTRFYRGRHVDGYELAKILDLDVDFEHG